MNKPELKTKYKDLVRQGKSKEAQKVLDQLRNFNKDEKPKKVNKPKKAKKKSVKKKEKDLDSLSKIKGIGKETLKDIKRMYKDIKSLKEDLQKDAVALRNDIVSKLKEELINGSN